MEPKDLKLILDELIRREAAVFIAQGQILALKKIIGEVAQQAHITAVFGIPIDQAFQQISDAETDRLVLTLEHAKPGMAARMQEMIDLARKSPPPGPISPS